MSYIPGRGTQQYGPGTSLVLLSQPAYPAPGLGCACAGMGCSCNKGMGLFDAGFDPTTFGIGEWAVIGIAGYMLLSTFITTKRGVSKVRSGVARRRRRAEEREEIRESIRKKKKRLQEL